MRPIPAEYRARVRVFISEEMTVDFTELGRVHPLYATYWMAKHMEEASRKIIVPFLEAHEDGFGRSVSVTHLAPAVPGMQVEFEAIHDRTEGNKVFAVCTAADASGELLGRGSTEQVVLPKTKVQEILQDVRRRARDLETSGQSPSAS